MTIPNFRQPQELELVVTWSSVSHQVLPSITSTELRKIIFPVRYVKDWTIFARQPEGRVFVDEQLCGVVYAPCDGVPSYSGGGAATYGSWKV